LENPDKIWTVLELVKWGSDYFGQKGIESPRLNIELLLCDVLSIDRIGIYTHFDQPLQKHELDILRNYVIRRGKREPLQYILKNVNFCGIPLLVQKGVLIPRPETEILVNEALKRFEKQDYLVADLGTGSGCIALSIAKQCPDAKVYAYDLSEDALAVARLNAQNNSLTNIDFQQIDILKTIPENIKFNFIISNPPYVELEEYNALQPEVKNYEPDFALTDNSDGLTFYRRYAQIFPEILSENGTFMLEIGYGQSDKIIDIFSTTQYSIEFIKDLSGINRIAHGKKRCHSSPTLSF